MTRNEAKTRTVTN